MSLTRNAEVRAIEACRFASLIGASLEGYLSAASEIESVKFPMVTCGQRRRILARLGARSSSICHVINPECRRECDLRVSTGIH